MFLNHHTPARAPVTSNNFPILRPRPLARIANLLLLNQEINFPPIVEISQWQRGPNFHIGSPSRTRRVPKMAPASEKSREQVERVVAAAAARRAALSVLLDAVVAVLVVDLAQGAGREDVVGVGDFDEFLARGFVVAKICGLIRT
jgi:hypothetical protein